MRRVRPPLETYYDGSNPGPAGAPWTPPPGMGRKTARQRCPLLRPSDDNGSDQDNTAKVYEGALPALHSGRSGSWETAWRSSTPAAPPTRAGTPAGAAAPAPPVRADAASGGSLSPPARAAAGGWPIYGSFWTTALWWSTWRDPPPRQPCTALRAKNPKPCAATGLFPPACAAPPRLQPWAHAAPCGPDVRLAAARCRGTAKRTASESLSRRESVPPWSTTSPRTAGSWHGPRCRPTAPPACEPAPAQRRRRHRAAGPTAGPLDSL